MVLEEFAFGGHDLDTSGIFQMRPKTVIPGLCPRYRTTRRMDLTWLYDNRLSLEAQLCLARQPTIDVGYTA